MSILPNREDQTVIQLWHAAGKIKRSGYSSLGKPDGRDQKVAEILCMHKNYDWIIAGTQGGISFTVSLSMGTEVS